MYTFNNGRKDLQFHKNRLAALDCSAIVTSLAGWVTITSQSTDAVILSPSYYSCSRKHLMSAGKSAALHYEESRSLIVIGSNTFHRGRSPAESKWDKADGEKAKAAGGKR